MSEAVEGDEVGNAVPVVEDVCTVEILKVVCQIELRTATKFLSEYIELLKTEVFVTASSSAFLVI